MRPIRVLNINRLIASGTLEVQVEKELLLLGRGIAVFRGLPRLLGVTGTAAAGSWIEGGWFVDVHVVLMALNKIYFICVTNGVLMIFLQTV